MSDDQSGDTTSDSHQRDQNRSGAIEFEDLVRDVTSDGACGSSSQGMEAGSAQDSDQQQDSSTSEPETPGDRVTSTIGAVLVGMLFLGMTAGAGIAANWFSYQQSEHTYQLLAAPEFASDEFTEGKCG